MGGGSDAEDGEDEIDDQVRTCRDDESDDRPIDTLFSLAFVALERSDRILVSADHDVDDEDSSHECNDDLDEVTDKDGDARRLELPCLKIAARKPFHDDARLIGTCQHGRDGDKKTDQETHSHSVACRVGSPLPMAFVLARF